MSHSYLDAFTYLFKHKNWFAKLLVGSLLFFFIKLIELAIKVLNSGDIPHLNHELLTSGVHAQVVTYILMSIGGIVLCVLAVWMSATLCGYFITAIRRYMRGQEDAIPDWDGIIGKLFFRGFKLFIGLFFINLLGFTFLQFVVNYSAFLAIKSLFYSLLAICAGIFVCMYVWALIPALIISFCEKDKFFAFFNLVRAKQIAAKNIKQYLLTLIKILSIILLIVLGNIIAQYYVVHCKED